MWGWSTTNDHYFLSLSPRFICPLFIAVLFYRAVTFPIPMMESGCQLQMIWVTGDCCAKISLDTKSHEPRKTHGREFGQGKMAAANNAGRWAGRNKRWWGRRPGAGDSGQEVKKAMGRELWGVSPRGWSGECEPHRQAEFPARPDKGQGD